MLTHAKTSARRGTIAPLLAVSLTGLMGFVALSVDVGMIAIARTQSQSAADFAALTGVRTLSGDPATANNSANAEPSARIAARSNKILGVAIQDSQIPSTPITGKCPAPREAPATPWGSCWPSTSSPILRPRTTRSGNLSPHPPPFRKGWPADWAGKGLRK